MDLFAIVGEAGSRPMIKQLTNAAQLDAFRYGLAFSSETKDLYDKESLI
jgi:hypothetical protein